MKNIIAGISLIAALTLLMAGIGGGAGQANRGSALESLIEAERAFSRTSEEKGIREAFLTWLSPHSVVFRPGPVGGWETYQKANPLDPAVLTWEPEVAEVSASGDFGYTSGPYTYRPGRRMEPTAFGHYVSVWMKKAGGPWKVELDIGVTYPLEARAAQNGEVATPTKDGGTLRLTPEQHKAAGYAFGQTTVSSFIRKASQMGLRKALAKFGTDDIRIYRPGRPPTVGKAQINRIVRDYAGRLGAIASDNKADAVVCVAWSGDLAYSYGTTFFYDTPRHQAKLVFFRIWRRETSGEWKVCLDVELPAPSPS